MIIVDTNYFLRFLLDDVSEQHQQAIDLFTQASQGKIKLTTDTIVIFEIYWVLKKYYGVENQLVKNSLFKICQLEFVHLSDRDILLDAITNFDSFNYDLEDAYHFYSALSQKVEKIATFDKKLSKKYLLKNTHEKIRFFHKTRCYLWSRK
jgi:predicted nucleic acid-binding protein